MNKERRTSLELAKTKIEEARALLMDAQGIVDTATSDERDYYDSMPESLRSGDKGNKADEAASELDLANEVLQGMDDAIDDVINAIDTAME
jgi:hypothetical protein